MEFHKKIEVVAYSGYKANERPLYFVLDGEPDIRVEFTLDDKSKEYEIIGHFPDGRKEAVKRIKKKK